MRYALTSIGGRCSRCLLSDRWAGGLCISTSIRLGIMTALVDEGTTIVGYLGIPWGTGRASASIWGAAWTPAWLCASICTEWGGGWLEIISGGCTCTTSSGGPTGCPYSLTASGCITGWWGGCWLVGSVTTAVTWPGAWGGGGGTETSGVSMWTICASTGCWTMYVTVSGGWTCKALLC